MNKHYKRALQKGFERLTTYMRIYEQTRNQMAQNLFTNIVDSGFQLAANLPAYSVEVHVPIVQKYFYHLPRVEDRCRLVVFGEVC